MIDTYSGHRHEASGEDTIAGDEGAATDGGKGDENEEDDV